MSLVNPGDCYKNFVLEKITPLPEIGCLLKELIHLPTGAQVMHIENDDPENVFCLSFRTLPDSSNGVAHILEHTVLCGSQKFPVKDPFFAMTRRSLNTFMNAFTGSDFTCYPAASQVPKDFYNLLEVYLDAVFHPHLKELSFRQEGHRLEFTQPNDEKTPLLFKGIVYNEMKGALTSPDRRLGDALDKFLFPDLTYGVNSGGDPEVIPQLTYQQLLDFHSTFYHPSRCLFYFYGNMPLESHLDFIEKQALSGLEKKDPIPLLAKQPRFQHPKKETIGYPFSAEEDPKNKTIINFGWLTCSILNQEELLALSIIAMVLLDTDASPLKMALLKSGLCQQVSASLVDECSEVPFSITLKGTDPEKGDPLELVIQNCLKELAAEGFPKDLVNNAFHQIEFHRSEISGDDLPFGLNLFMRAGLLKQNGGNPASALLIHSLCRSLREKIENQPLYLESLIKTHLLDNPHFVRVMAIPDKELTLKEAAQERASLDAIQKELSPEKIKELIEDAQKLEQFQLEQEETDIEVLPKISLKDVPKEARHYPLSVEKRGNLSVYRHCCFTNGIVYADLILPLPHLEEKELPLFKLFSLLLPQIGSGGRTYEDNLKYIQAHTGGMGTSQSLNSQATDSNQLFPSFQIQGKALYRNRKKLIQLLFETVTSPDFTDAARLKEMIRKHVTSLESVFNQNALRYAMGLASASKGIASRIGYAWGGLEYYYYIKELAAGLDQNISKVIEQLQDLHHRALKQGMDSIDLILACDEACYQEMAGENFYGLEDLSIGKHPLEHPVPLQTHYSLPSVVSQGRIIPSPVAFTCQVYQTLPYIHEDTAALSVAARLFDNLVLHPQIREKGGAYGSGAGNHSLSGIFTFYAYRDPHIAGTLASFEEAMESIIKGEFTETDIEEAKLEIIQDLDTPINPGSRAHAAYFWMREGRTPEIRQAFRNQLLSVDRKEIIKAVEKHLIPQIGKGTSVVFADRDLLEKENVLLNKRNKDSLQILTI